MCEQVPVLNLVASQSLGPRGLSTRRDERAKKYRSKLYACTSLFTKADARFYRGGLGSLLVHCGSSQSAHAHTALLRPDADETRRVCVYGPHLRARRAGHVRWGQSPCSDGTHAYVSSLSGSAAGPCLRPHQHGRCCKGKALSWDSCPSHWPFLSPLYFSCSARRAKQTIRATAFSTVLTIGFLCAAVAAWTKPTPYCVLSWAALLVALWLP
jgi:hypothetical protein